MAKTGDSYTVTLNYSHLGWGTNRNTGSREPIKGERYLPIPKAFSKSFNILNSNGTGKTDILGKNLFNCRSKDGTFVEVLKAQGCSKKGDIYAKQFSVNNDLKKLKTWYDYKNAAPGDEVKVTWTSPTDIEIELL